MTGKVFFSVTMSLDGFIAPEERMDDADNCLDLSAPPEVCSAVR